MLNQIFSATQLISVKREKSTDKSWNVKDYLRLIEEAVKKMNDMCTEVLDYSHGNITLETKRININEFLDEYIKKVRKTVESYGISMYTNIQSERIVDIDIDKLNRVLNNIIYNAVDALNKRENPNISINCYEHEKYKQVIIEIEDNGVGIPEQHLEKVFEPFFTHGKSYGTGLGLSISKDIIYKYHKGSISIKSEEDKGTIVSILLPYC
jgi:signal transduction histidine kinase